jgi:4'-phosphopantetheinyl transferase EntD
LQEEHLLAQSSLSFEAAFTLAFSAKESLFKALYPSVGDYFDFSSAKITNICCSTNSFSMTLLKDLSKKLTRGNKFTGSFYFGESYVFTLIAQ